MQQKARPMSAKKAKAQFTEKPPRSWLMDYCAAQVPPEGKLVGYYMAGEHRLPVSRRMYEGNEAKYEALGIEFVELI